jgi:N-acyl-D-amino-acid deacylase
MFMSGEISQTMETPAPADCPTIIRYMLGQTLDFDPGTQYAYSNFGYCVLGRVIEKVTGMGYEDYVRTHILAPVGIDDMHIGHTLLDDRYPGEVRYYGTEATLTPSVFPEITEFTAWPYGGFFLEAMDSHGGWIASAPDLVRFASALEDTKSTPLLEPETLDLMVSRPAIPLWEGTVNYYALGWFVRPSSSGETLWHGGSLPGTTTVLYRSANGLTWAALFNTRADPPDDTFLIEFITAMGLASIMNNVILGAVIIVVLLGAGVFSFLRRRRRRRKL